jgi:hypothetical protein
MLSSFLVRLLTDDLTDGQLAGEVQVVATGERVTVRSSEELIAVLVSSMSGRGDAGEPRGGEDT